MTDNLCTGVFKKISERFNICGSNLDRAMIQTEFCRKRPSLSTEWAKN